VDARPVHLDLHNHTVFSPDGIMEPIRFLQVAASRGLGCVAVTDHDSFRGALECLELAAADPLLPRVIAGEEIRTLHGEIIGLFLREEIPGGLSPLATVALIREQGGLVYLPHPFDGVRESAFRGEELEQIAGMVDVVEVNNGRSMRRAYGRNALRLAARIGTLLGAGSDAHFEGEVGRSYMDVPRVPVREDFMEVLRKGRPSPDPGVADLALNWVYGAATGVAKAARARHGSRLRRSPAGT
jgi:predicted metal-dependent phosphoesterase TrpH